MSEYHEPDAELSSEVRDQHRALTSLKEELEAIDWYNQRWAASRDETLRAVLAHNRDEEIEHACMVLEWLRRNVPAWDATLRSYLFTDAPITQIEQLQMARAPGDADPAPAASGGAGDLGIGTLRRKA